MLVFKISALALSALFIINLLRQENKTFAIALSIITGLCIIYLLLPQLNTILAHLKNMYYSFNPVSLKSIHLDVLLKAIGISYVCEISSQICKDAGEQAIANKIDICGKILVVSCSLPILNQLIDTITNLI